MCENKRQPSLEDFRQHVNKISFTSYKQLEAVPVNTHEMIVKLKQPNSGKG
jgi:hypothetical protein